jgi:capsular exopolysaccharide synthesis family protein
LVTDGAVGAEARKQLGSRISTKVGAVVDPDRQVITISGSSRDRDAATIAANTYAHALIDYLANRDLDTYQTQVDELQHRLDAATTLVDDLQEQIADNPKELQLYAQRDSALGEYRSALDSQRSIQATGVPEPLLGSVADAVAFRVPIAGYTGLPHVEHALLGLALGILLGLGLAYVLDALDRRLASAESASLAFDLPVLAEVPDGGRLFRKSDQLAPSGSAINEAYRRLRTVLILEKQASTERTTMVVLVVSPGPGEGKTTTVAHLARALGEVGHQVLAVSADFRRPRLHRLFGAPVTKGLAALSEEDAPTGAGELLQRTNLTNVRLLTAGPGTSDPTELIRNTRRVIRAARGHFDFVVVDTSPLLSANDTLDLLDIADRVVIVARYRHTQRAAAERVRSMLAQTTAPSLGVVLTDVSSDQAYGYYYGYGTESTPSLT